MAQVICVNAVLNALAKSLQWRKALVQLEHMETSGPKPTEAWRLLNVALKEAQVISFNTALSALRGFWPRSLALLKHMQVRVTRL